MSVPVVPRIAGVIVVILLLTVALAGCTDAGGSSTPVAATVQTGQRGTPTASPTPEATPPVAVNTPSPTSVPPASPTQSPTPVPTAPPTATAAEPTATPVATATASATPTSTPTAAPTLEPTPTVAQPATAEQITRVEPGQGEVALLFNGDSFAGHIATILDTTRARDTTLTFFLTGGYLERYPDQVRAIDAAGHEIASHGYDHVDFRDLPDADIVSQIDQWRAKLAELAGKVGPQYWQPPYGYSDARVRQAAAAHGYTTIYWTRDVLDAVGQPKSKQFVLDRVLQSSIELDGAIILMHVDKDGTIEALPELLDALAQRGLRAVTVSELLRK